LLNILLLCNIIYVQTITIHLPILGEIDTGITPYQLSQFKKAQIEYDNRKQQLKNKYKSKIITEKEYTKQILQIGMDYISDKRITTITGSSAKKFIK